jgi:ubiquinone/menaquinone biosynthesis C-methylase UbiE
LSSCLASITGAKVTGLDINRTELEQARRVFQKANLQFVLGDIRNGLVKGEFDAIIFAASLQYFKPLEETINACFQHLKPGGEIHVLDTQFYSESGQVEARKRSEDYFKKLASVAMQEYYFHHSLRDLEPFRYKVLFNPSSFFNKVFKAGPFPWICITK